MDFMNFLSSHWVEIGTAMTWCLGGFLSGVCAMGAALFAVPVTALFLPMQDAILISCMTLPFMDMAMSLLPSAFLPLEGPHSAPSRLRSGFHCRALGHR